MIVKLLFTMIKHDTLVNVIPVNLSKKFLTGRFIEHTENEQIQLCLL